MSTFFAALLGFFKFFELLVPLIQKLEKTPAEKRQEVIRRVHEAISKTEASGGDTSDEEGIING